MYCMIKRETEISRPIVEFPLTLRLFGFSCSSCISTLEGSHAVNRFNTPTHINKQIGIFPSHFTSLLYVHIYATLQIFMQLPATLIKLCHTVNYAQPPSSHHMHKMFTIGQNACWHFSQTVGRGVYPPQRRGRRLPPCLVWRVVPPPQITRM